MKRFLKIASAALVATSALSAVAAPHDPIAEYRVEAIPFSFQPGKSMDDLMALKEEFGKLSEEGDTQYSAYIMTPHFVSQGSGPIENDYDGVWIGVAPNATAIAKGFRNYLENGSRLESKFQKVISFRQRMLNRGEIIHRGDDEDAEGPVFAMFSTCRLKEGASRTSMRAADSAWSARVAELGLKSSSHVWWAGFGVPDALQGAFITARFFPNIEAWGESLDSLNANGMFMTAEWRAMRETMSCGPARTYLGTAFYEAE
jgi:hypothetical protein